MDGHKAGLCLHHGQWAQWYHLYRRHEQPREARVGASERRRAGLTHDYGCKLLVWHLAFDDIQDARAYELRMKKWNRAWKLRAIEEMNPLWNDLYPTLNS